MSAPRPKVCGSAHAVKYGHSSLEAPARAKLQSRALPAEDSMRRLLPCIAALALLACAGAPKRTAAPAAAPVDARPPVLPGFEKQPNEVLTEYSLKDAAGKEVLLRKEKDLNGDGKIDAWEKYAADGALVRVVYDLDFDGKPDVTLFYEKDQLVKKELAFGFDGVPRSWNHYEKGKLVRKERDTNGDGQVDYWEYWENGEVDRIGVDEDGDGQVDRWEAKKTAEAGAPGEGDKPVAPQPAAAQPAPEPPKPAQK